MGVEKWPGSVGEFLDALDPRERDLVGALRDLVRELVPEAEESVVWGCISYHRPWLGGKIVGGVCQIVVRRGQVRLDLVHGVRLDDPDGLLRGDGKSKRFVPIDGLDPVDDPAVWALVRRAADFQPRDRPGRN
jgi:hypothetical protein